MTTTADTIFDTITIIQQITYGSRAVTFCVSRDITEEQHQAMCDELWTVPSVSDIRYGFDLPRA